MGVTKRPRRGRGMRRCIAILLAALAACSLTGCGSDDSYRDTLNSGLSKYYSGESMSRSEYNAVRSFNDWKSKQGSKTYDDWGG